MVLLVQDLQPLLTRCTPAALVEHLLVMAAVVAVTVVWVQAVFQVVVVVQADTVARVAMVDK